MADVVAREQSPSASREQHSRWVLLRAGIGRVSRWFVCSVLLAAVPILLSLLALPPSASVTMLLSHGDFAVLASALAAASIGELLGPTQPSPGVRNMLVLASLLLFTFTIILLAGIAGSFARLTPELDARFSVISFLVATIIGIASWGATIEKVQESKSRDSHGRGEDGEPE